MTDTKSIDQMIEEEANLELLKELEEAFSNVKDVIDKHNRGATHDLELKAEDGCKVYAHTAILSLQSHIYNALKPAAKKKKVKAFYDAVKCFQRKEGL